MRTDYKKAHYVDVALIYTAREKQSDLTTRLHTVHKWD